MKSKNKNRRAAEIDFEKKKAKYHVYQGLEYERFAQKTNWDTNEKCKVAFDDFC